METNSNISCQDSKILPVCLNSPFTRSHNFLISRDTFPSSYFYAEIILMLKDITNPNIFLYSQQHILHISAFYTFYLL